MLIFRSVYRETILHFIRGVAEEMDSPQNAVQNPRTLGQRFFPLGLGEPLDPRIHRGSAQDVTPVQLYMILLLTSHCRHGSVLKNISLLYASDFV